MWLMLVLSSEGSQPGETLLVTNQGTTRDIHPDANYLSHGARLSQVRILLLFLTTQQTMWGNSLNFLNPYPLLHNG